MPESDISMFKIHVDGDFGPTLVHHLEADCLHAAVVLVRLAACLGLSFAGASDPCRLN